MRQEYFSLTFVDHYVTMLYNLSMLQAPDILACLETAYVDAGYAGFEIRGANSALARCIVACGKSATHEVALYVHHPDGAEAEYGLLVRPFLPDGKPDPTRDISITVDAHGRRCHISGTEGLARGDRLREALACVTWDGAASIIHGKMIQEAAAVFPWRGSITDALS